MPNETLIDAEFITSKLTTDDPWCSSHGSGNGLVDLGAGMLYYAIAYALKAKTCVCLGSGGGFVPRMMRQAQRDLNVEGSRTILVDGSPKVDPQKQKIWGIPCWLPEDSVFRSNYPEIEILLELTKTAFEDYFAPKDVRIDFLHIDADHHYEGAKLDWDLFHTLVPDSGVITLHDTINFREPCGVPQLLEEIRQHGDFGVVNLPIAYGTAIIKKHGTR